MFPLSSIARGVKLTSNPRETFRDSISLHDESVHPVAKQLYRLLQKEPSKGTNSPLKAGGFAFTGLDLSPKEITCFITTTLVSQTVACYETQEEVYNLTRPTFDTHGSHARYAWNWLSTGEMILMCSWFVLQLL